jgi:hypothetical protein
MEFIDYVILLKNIRGILLFEPTKEPDLDKIKWLKKTHKYRNIGIPESIDKFKSISDKPFVKLSYPSDEINIFLNKLKNGLPLYLLEAVALSSCYACPLLILNQEIFDQLKPITIWSLKASEIDKKEILRHIRISHYSQIDFFSSAKQAYEILKEGKKIEDLCNNRKELAILDGKKRFWRIKEDKNSNTLVAYFDLLRIIKNIKDIKSIISLALSISCGFRI